MKTSESNKSLCELCHCAPSDIYTRNAYARHAGARYAQTRTNRVRIDSYMASQSGYPSLTGKLVCNECYAHIVYIVNNALYAEGNVDIAVRLVNHKAALDRLVSTQ